MRLEYAQFADALGRNAAGGNIGYAPALKLQSHVGNVDFGRQNRDAGRANLFYFTLDQAEQNVDIVDHQIENDVDIEAPRAENAQPMDFEEQRQPCDFFQRHDSRIEALEMSDLQNAAML